MTDNWSLKGKKWWIDTNSHSQWNETTFNVCKPNEHEIVYLLEDINTLKKKLIDDIIDDTSFWMIKNEDFEPFIISLIGKVYKRFGIEE